MTVTVVTSCSLAGWNSYAGKGIATLLQHWPVEANIHLVSEDKLPLENVERWVGRPDRFHFHPLLNHAEAKLFYERHADNKRCKGTAKNFYDFRLDAFRFSKKVFAIQMIAAKVQTGRLLWLDADTVTLHPVPMEMLERMPPEEFGLAYLARNDNYHSECGFVGYNLNLSETHQFINQFAGLYATDEVFKLREWHDSWVFDWTRKATGIKGYKIPHTNHGQPFNFSELGKYLDHLKGNSKRLGMSTLHPRHVRRKG
jgi:hypothetical protein